MILIKKENYVKSILIGGAVGLGLEALLGLASYSACSSSQGGA